MSLQHMNLRTEPEPHLRYGSVCSGIEAVSLAWQPLGLQAAWFSEIEPFPCAVLSQHYPNVPNHGDMTRLPVQILSGQVVAPDVLVGGTPCQAFSVAGLRGGLADPRGALTLKYVELANAIDLVRSRCGLLPTVAVWENVPGVLYGTGHAFGCFLGALSGEDRALQPAGGRWTDAGCVYGPRRAIAWRVLDAQYFGLAQRRRRVFVVASARTDIDPAAVLFEYQSLRRDTAPRRTTRPGTAGGPAAGTGARHDAQTLSAYGGGNRRGAIDVAACLTARGQRLDFEIETLAVHGIQTPLISDQAFTVGRNQGQETVTLAFSENSRAEIRLQGQDGMIAGALSTGGGKPGQGYPCVLGQPADAPPQMLTHSIQLAHTASHGSSIQPELSHTLDCSISLAVHQHTAPRRLMPHECEALQGLPRDYTQIPWRGRIAENCPDGPRYKAIGNSMAVPCLRWIGERLLQALTT